MGIELVVLLIQSLAWFAAGVVTGYMWKEVRLAYVRK